MLTDNNNSLADLSVDDLTQGYADGTMLPAETTKVSMTLTGAFNREANAYCRHQRGGGAEINCAI